MTDPHDNLQNPHNDDIERVLTEGLRAEPLDAAAMQRLRDVASREWQLSVDRRRFLRPLRHRVWAAAAALACLMVGVTWFFLPVAHPELFGVVLRTDASEGGLTAGVALNVGDVLNSHGPALIILAAGGTLRVAPDTVLKLTSATETALQRGRIYLDFPPTARSAAFDVSTRVGTVEHVGTAFEVLSNSEMVRIRVREGRVRLRGESKETLLEAGTQLTADREGHISLSVVASYGPDWLWVAALAADYEIEGRPLLDFLQWAARELGREVKFSDARAREVAERTILHGSVKGREPMDALSSVLSTTSLTYEIRGDTIWIQSGHGT